MHKVKNSNHDLALHLGPPMCTPAEHLLGDIAPLANTTMTQSCRFDENKIIAPIPAIPIFYNREKYIFS